MFLIEDYGYEPSECMRIFSNSGVGQGLFDYESGLWGQDEMYVYYELLKELNLPKRRKSNMIGAYYVQTEQDMEIFQMISLKQRD